MSTDRLSEVAAAPEATASTETADACAQQVPQACDAGLARVFEFLGKRWNGLILATLLGGPAGFADLRRAVGNISDSMLSDRLGELAAAGLVDRLVDPGPPVAVSYRLTTAGTELMPALAELETWARRNRPAPEPGQSS